MLRIAVRLLRSMTPMFSNRIDWIVAIGFRRVSVASALVLLLAVFTACDSETGVPSDDDAPRSRGLGGSPTAGSTERAPGVAIPIVGVAQLEARIDRFRGRGLLINFWSLACPPCIVEIPHLVAVHEEFLAKGGRLLSVNYDVMNGARFEEVRPDVQAFVAEHGIEFPVVVFDDPGAERVAGFSLPTSFPVTVALDARGRVVERHTGLADRVRLAAMMLRALEE